MHRLKIKKGQFGMDLRKPIGSELGTPWGYRPSYDSISRVSNDKINLNQPVVRQNESSWKQALDNGTAKSSLDKTQQQGPNFGAILGTGAQALGKVGGLAGKGAFKAYTTLGKNADLVQQTFGIDVDEDSTYRQEQMVGDMMLSSGNPYVMAAGAIVKANSLMNQAMGTNMNTLTNHQAEEIGMNKAQNALNTGLGFFLNTAGPGLGAAFSKTINAEKSQDVDFIRGAYAGTVDDIDQSQKMGGKRYALAKKKANRYINTANQRNAQLTAIAQENTPLRSTAGSTALDYNKQLYNLINGMDYQNTGTVEMGEYGMKLLSKRELAKIYAARKPKEEIDNFGDGGKIGVDNNVIPEGALHATKNNLEKVNPELDEVTPKGIPVVVTDNNGDYKQVAEIERDELVLTKEVTLAIEDLWKKGTPEDMIEAGRILAKELMENTVNNGDNKD